MQHNFFLNSGNNILNIAGKLKNYEKKLYGAVIADVYRCEEPVPVVTTQIVLCIELNSILED